MRLISYRDGQGERLGARAGDQIVDLNATSESIPADIVEFLRGGAGTLQMARDAVDAADATFAPEEIELLPVVPRPPKILCVARNYGAHAAEANLDVLEVPNIFIRYPGSLLADGEPLQVPVVSEQLDWEAELAAVIGIGGKHISRETALDHVAGYAIFNDASVRDWQLRKPPIQFGAGKNFDASGPFGPDLVTADEIDDPQALDIKLTVNGDLMQGSNTSEMIFPVDRLIEFISSYSTLEPGDVIATGTPSGVGNFRKPPVFLKPGDRVKITIEGIGVQESPVIAEPPIS